MALATWFLISILLDAQSQNTRSIRFLALGDSYTIGESVAEKDRWPNRLAQELSQRSNHTVLPAIIATTGWRTDNLINAIRIAKLKEDYDLVSLLIGVNNQYQGKAIEPYAAEFEELLKTAIRLAKGKRENVFVVSIPDYGFTPFGLKNKERISGEINQFNQVNKKLADQYQVRYVNITSISRQGLIDPDLVASDGLHPSAKMYALWVKEISKIIGAK